MCDIFRVLFASGLWKVLKLINGSRFCTNFVIVLQNLFSPLSDSDRACSFVHCPSTYILSTNSSLPSFHFFHHSDQSRLLVRNQSISFFLLINIFTEAIVCSGYWQSGARPPFVCAETNIVSQFLQT